VQAIDAGAHVFVEKPLAPDLATTRQILAHAARAQRQLTVGYRYLFDPPALTLRALLAAGELGEPVHLESFYGYDLGGAFGAAMMADPTHWVHRLPGKMVLTSSFGVYAAASVPRGHVIDERTGIEPHPERRDLYSQAKLRQERLFREYQERLGFPLVVLRPGVIYGPRGARFSARVGLDLMGVFLHPSGDNTLPLTYVDNCAEALVLAGRSEAAAGQTYNVVDDDLVTCRQYLRRYQDEVQRLRVVPVPYPALRALSSAVQRYHAFSQGQLPAIFTPYKTATSWKGHRFDNAKLKGLGWRPIVSTEEGVRRAFAHFKANPT